MPAGEKSKYTKKQIRQAEHIEGSYEARGYSEQESERRAWATVNRLHGGEKLESSDRRSGETRAAQNRDEDEPESRS